MKNSILSFVKFIAVLFFAILFTSCKKKIPQNIIESKYFNHVYTLPFYQEMHTMVQTADKGYLLIGHQLGEAPAYEDKIVLIKTDAGGLVQSIKYIEGDTFFTPFISRAQDGGIFICPSNMGHYLFKLDNNGNQVFKKSFSTLTPYADYFSFPIENEKGNIAFSMSSQTTNFGDFFIFDAGGNFIKKIPIIKSSLLYGADHNCIYKYTDTGTFYYYGIGKYNYNTSQIGQIFVAKQVNNVQTNTAIVDIKNISNINLPFGDVYLNHLLLPNGKLILYNRQLEASGKFKGYIALIDINQNLIWDTDLKIGTNGTFPRNISLCPDGNLLITGACKTKDNLLYQPFACKMNLSGNVIWSKVFTTAISGTFNMGIQLPNGNFVFAGTSDAYGKGANLNDMFLMKTDANGNLNE
jgi:hypothetical protein